MRIIMKKVLCILSVLAAVVALSGCQNSNPSANENSDISKEISDAVSAVSDGYYTAEKVAQANIKSAGIMNTINDWFTDCDTLGVLYNKEELSFITVTVTDGVWRVTISDTSIYSILGDSNKSEILSTGAENGTRAGNHVETNNVTEKLEIDLANANTDLDNAYICAAIYKEKYGGKCRSVYFVDGTTDPIQEITDNIGDQAEWIDSTYPWSGDIDGTLADGTVVGTAPSI